MIAYVTPLFLIVLVPLGLFYYYTQVYYIKTAREVQRLDSVLRSPILSHFGETLAGVASIRAYRVVDRFVDMNMRQLTASMRAYFNK